MKKSYILALLMSGTTLTYADSMYTNFQQFDNQVGFGMNYQNGNFNNSQSNGNPNQFSVTNLNLEIEKLFDLGLWMDINAGVTQTYTQTNMPTTGAPAQPIGSYPYLQTMNGKFGYNIPLCDNFAIVPYITLGKNANVNSYVVLAGTQSGQIGVNVTNDFFYTLGGGVRLELPINKYIDIYLDQMLAANLDQTTYNVGTTDGSQINASNNQWTTTLGVKVNPWEKLQLGANIFYTNYTGYSQSSINSLNSMQVAVPATAFGFQVSAGFTFQ